MASLASNKYLGLHSSISKDPPDSGSAILGYRRDLRSGLVASEASHGIKSGAETMAPVVLPIGLTLTLVLDAATTRLWTSRLPGRQKRRRVTLIGPIHIILRCKAVQSCSTLTLSASPLSFYTSVKSRRGCLRIPAMSTAQSPSDVYARLLLPKRQGYPLWVPEPNTRLPDEYKERGVGIGDVGIITPDGAFDFLFSICHPANHPINCNGVPDDFEPLKLNYLDIHEISMIWGPRSDIASVSIKKDMLTLGASAENA